MFKLMSPAVLTGMQCCHDKDKADYIMLVWTVQSHRVLAALTVYRQAMVTPVWSVQALYDGLRRLCCLAGCLVWISMITSIVSVVIGGQVIPVRTGLRACSSNASGDSRQAGTLCYAMRY